MEAKNVDDILVKDMQNQQAPVQPAPQPPAEPPASEPAPPPVPAPEEAKTEPEAAPEVPRGTNEQKESAPAPDQTENKQNPNIDEYGNPVEKPRTYTEEEVQRMIRERFNRGRHADQPPPTPAHVQEAAKDFKADPDSEQSWEVQLNNFIDKRLETRQAQLKQQEWQQQEQQKQADFEVKFNAGMNKYPDFENVVSKVAPSITPSMMLATRSLENPAAFLYAAAKLHPGELDRISKLGDNFVQAAEIGRLHEKMVKQRTGVSLTPKPIDAPKSDIPNKPINPQRSLDQRIHDYAKQKRR